MISKKQNYILKKVIDRFGETSQVVVAIEELAELIKELTKRLRGHENFYEIAEEIADVEVMIAQLKQIFKCEDTVNETIEFKIQRTLKLLDDMEEQETEGQKNEQARNNN